ncbi:DUF4393 domain-containing protein [Paenibacillus sp. Marseille-Q4541]|uniref:DUF4393 domain-containing protein n=1 Tax=Paenibacillus sp. Marseille-Q4541 TaxID=2831522 RepID=UPI001BA4A936|nr:DUF4393 domain-containing protein [Paenibacillus sp. Marseille-Q4541]
MFKELGQASADISKEVLIPPAKELGNVLGDMVSVSFGWLAKIKIKQEHNIQLFKEGLQDGLDNIKPENLVQPPLHIVGPAIKASKYYIETDELRQMFINLVVSSSDRTKQTTVHPSFVEIIKQLSSVDATCFRYLCENTKTAGCCSLRLYDTSVNDGSYRDFKYIFDFPGVDTENFVSYMTVADNLIRLGLIECIDTSTSSDKSRYTKLRSIDFISSVNGSRAKPFNIEFNECFWSLTSLGSSFKSTVL